MMNSLWEQVLARFKERIAPHCYGFFFAQIQCEGLQDGRLSLTTPTRFVMQWVQDNYLQDIIREIAQLSPTPIEVELKVVATDAAEQRSEAQIQAAHEERSHRRSKRSPALEVQAKVVPAPQGLQPHYRFDNFVSGAANELALCAARSAAERPGGRYNPIFIHGAPGLGKTHLLHAVGHELYRRHPHTRVVYIGAEQFLIDFVRATQSKSHEAFRQRFRDHCDCLLIDDIQFLARGERTMEEFFHVFNALHAAGKQIIVTGDRSPNEMTKMEERLVSRLNWGLVADVQAPDTETRFAIVQRLAAREQVIMSQRAMILLAQTVVQNVRELEGTFLRLAACADLRNESIDEAFVRRELDRQRGAESGVITVESIQEAVSSYFSLRVSDLKGPRRHRSVARPRMLAMYLSRELTGASFPEIGNQFGGKDHTTVMNACRRIPTLADQDSELRSAVESLTCQLQSKVA